MIASHTLAWASPLTTQHTFFSTPVKVRPVEEEEEEEEVVEEAKNDKNVEIVLPPQNSPVKQSPVKKLDLSALISHDVDDIRTVSWQSWMKNKRSKKLYATII